MVKVFTLNEKGKIELTKEELEKLLDEAYFEGRKYNYWTYTTPSINTTPAITWCNDNGIAFNTSSTSTIEGK